MFSSLLACAAGRVSAGVSAEFVMECRAEFGTPGVLPENAVCVGILMVKCTAAQCLSK